ncbi:VWD domain-containing protein [Myxococcus stipitatus]|uniref:VWD domain-containing protein n=1 Tax=Myxococcus stipitatus TaxID=83455 RepID=UPI001F2573D4|nr:VWD domain-containing protein [Myxococcus stipitatus]MCE9666339.1 VWD domain-containing protein [Myxococcus stipitatus]
MDVFDVGLSHLGDQDVVVVKHDSLGLKTWAWQFGTEYSDIGTGIATHTKTGNTQVYVTGYTYGAMGDNGLPNVGGTDVFLARLDPNTGKPIWKHQFGSTGDDQATGIATTQSGVIYVAGTTTGTLDGTTPPDPLKNGFIARFNANGGQDWILQFGNAAIEEEIRGIATDFNDDVYVVGHTYGNMGAAHKGGGDAFIAKFSKLGQPQPLWTRQLGTTKEDSFTGVATARRSLSGSLTDIDVYMSGYTGANFDGQTAVGGEFDAIVVKYDGAGTKKWSRQFGSRGSDRAYGVASDGGANVYVTGATDYDLTAPEPQNYDNIFLVKYDAGGGTRATATRQLGSTSEGDPSMVRDVGKGVAADIFNGVYIAGITQGSFTTTPPTVQHGDDDYVVLRYQEGCTITTPGKCGIGYGWGDPHLVTFDGRAYDFQGAGEYVLVESTDLSAPLVVQARMQPWGTSTTVSVMTAVATRLGTNRVSAYLTPTGLEVRVDGVAISLPDGSVFPLPGGGRVLRQDATTYVFFYTTLDRMTVTLDGTYLNVNLGFPETRKGKVRGLLGNYDGALPNDFALRNGAVLTPPLSFSQLYTSPQSLSTSWRITQQESLFDYAAGESTATFTRLDFPAAPIGVGDLNAAQREEARVLCAAVGVTSPFILDSCTLDVALTQDPSFATSAARMESRVRAQMGTSMPEPTPSGRWAYFANFQSPLYGEWSKGLVSTSPQGGKTFLGRFGNENITLSLAALPSHTTVTVSFDLFIIGGWIGESAAGPVYPTYFGLRANNAPLMQYVFSNTPGNAQTYPVANSYARTGGEALNTLGYAYGDTTYRMRIKFNSSTPSLALTFYAGNLTSARNETWGLDNVEVQVE